MPIEQYANDYSTTLNGAINNSQTTLTLTSATGAPLAPFRIRIDNEIMLVGARTTTACSSITRGVEGTTAASHADLATITHVLTRAGAWALGGVFDVRAYGATGDGSTNDTTAFTNAIAAAGAGGTVYVPDGTYMVTLVDLNQTGLAMLLTAGATIKQINATNNSNVIRMSAARTLIEGGTVDGNGTNNSSSSTIRCEADDTTVRYVRIINTRQYGVWCQYSRNDVIGCYFGNPQGGSGGSATMTQPIDNSADRYGGLISGNRIVVTNTDTAALNWAGIGGTGQNTIGGIRVIGLRVIGNISVLPLTNTRENISIAWSRDCVFAGNYTFGGGFGISIPDSFGVVLDGNIIGPVLNTGFGIELARSFGKVVNNVVDFEAISGGTPTGMLFSAALAVGEARAVHVANNVLRKCRTGISAGSNSLTRMSFDGNIFDQCGGGVDADGTYGITFEGASTTKLSTRNNRFYSFTGTACIGFNNGTSYVSQGDEFHDVGIAYRVAGGDQIRIRNASFYGTTSGLTVVSSPTDLQMHGSNVDTWDRGYGMFFKAGALSAGDMNGRAFKGALATDTTNGKVYINTGTQASTTWTVVGSQT